MGKWKSNITPYAALPLVAENPAMLSDKRKYHINIRWLIDGSENCELRNAFGLMIIQTCDHVSNAS